MINFQIIIGFLLLFTIISSKNIDDSYEEFAMDNEESNESNQSAEREESDESYNSSKETMESHESKQSKGLKQSKKSKKSMKPKESSNESGEEQSCDDYSDESSDAPNLEKNENENIIYQNFNKVNIIPDSCGLVSIKRSFPKIVGGRNSEIGAWPWLAVLAYDLVLRIAFSCGGSLVTSKHVITAAHCLRDNLIFVRLGEFDLSKEDETKSLDVNISKIIQSDFEKKSGRNDLAILVLANKVEFTDLISPICLPISQDLRKKSFLNSKPFVAGWGYTREGAETAKILQELQITIMENKVCYDKYKARSVLDAENQFDESVICAGQLEGGKDSCGGDSGGPLMIPEMIDGSLRYFLIGVVSHGVGCARKDMPSSYSNVPFHMEWILKQLQEN